MTALKDFVGGGGGIEMQTIFEEDFAALGNQDLKTGGDGTKSVNGTTWNVINQANASNLEIVNGQGLRIRAIAGTQSSGGANSYPRFFGTYNNLIASNYQSSPEASAQLFEDLRWWVALPTVNVTGTNYEQLAFYIGVEPADSNTYQDCVVVGQATNAFMRHSAAGNFDHYCNTTLYHNLSDFDCLCVRVQGVTAYGYLGSLVGGNFPDFSAMTPLGAMPRSTGIGSSTNVLNLSASIVAFGLSCGPNGGGTPEFYVPRVKIEAPVRP